MIHHDIKKHSEIAMFLLYPIGLMSFIKKTYAIIGLFMEDLYA